MNQPAVTMAITYAIVDPKSGWLLGIGASKVQALTDARGDAEHLNGTLDERGCVSLVARQGCHWHKEYRGGNAMAIESRD